MNDIKYLFLGIATAFFIVITKAIVQTLAERWSKKEWVGLTEEEVKNEVEFFFRHSYVDDPDRLFLFAQTIEAKLKEKNHGN